LWIRAGVAQLVEQLIRNQQVLGSSPSAGSNPLKHLQTNLDRARAARATISLPRIDPSADNRSHRRLSLHGCDPARAFGQLSDRRTTACRTAGATATLWRAFDGQSQASVIAKILEFDPAPIRSLQPMSPAGFDRLVKTCLALCTLDKVVFSGSWSKNGVLLLGGFGGPVLRVSADGGVPVPVTMLDAAHGDVAHTNPFFLPDGRHFIYLQDEATSAAVSVGSLDAKPEEQDSRRLIDGVTQSEGTTMRFLLHCRQRSARLPDYSSETAWPPDGRRMIFGVAHSGKMADLYQKAIDTAGDGELVFQSNRS
jgi:hypothetical protein